MPRPSPDKGGKVLHFFKNRASFAGQPVLRKSTSPLEPGVLLRRGRLRAVRSWNPDLQMKWPSHLLLVLVLGFLTACASSTPSPAPPAPKPVASDADSASQPPLVIHNSDGTFTIQKEPPKGNAEDANAKKGLVIPPQVVVPIASPPKKQN